MMRRFLLLVCLVGCAGGKNYGYSREYVPLSEESNYLDRSTELTYEELRRDPAGHASELVGWFGIVTGAEKRGDQTMLNMELRFHQERHLCGDQFDSSCRVTVSRREGGPFSVLLNIRPEDRAGRHRLSPGSLVRAYGHAIEDYDSRGGPILKADFYRHWPHGTYVFAGQHRGMRR